MNAKTNRLSPAQEQFQLQGYRLIKVDKEGIAIFRDKPPAKRTLYVHSSGRYWTDR